jgi:hypothetical protein
MNWKDELRKAPPFAVKPIVEAEQAHSVRQLEELLEKTLDEPLKNHISEFPNKNRFTLPMDNATHSELTNLAGGKEKLEDMIQALYELRSFHIKPGAIRGRTAGQMAYHFELL